MIKKNSWIVALILALSLTVFFGCVDGFVPEADEDTYTEFELKEFNTKGGNPYQEGWANDGSVWGDPDHTAKAIGLDLETLQKAKYLKFELNAEPLAGAMDVILGGDSKGWVQNASTVKAGVSGTVEINLTLLNGYSDFIGAKEKARIIIQYNQAGQGNAGVVKNPRLLISDKAAEIPTDEVYAGGEITIVGNVATHTNPGFTARPGSTIKSDGTITIQAGSSLLYKFPKTATFDIADYRNFKITYEVSNIVKTSGGAGEAKAIFGNLSGGDYGLGATKWLSMNIGSESTALNGAGGGSESVIETKGDGATGGFSIAINNFDIATSGCDSFDLKIKKIEFTKGTKVTVEFYSTWTMSEFDKLEWFEGIALGDRLPSVSLSGATFMGWYDKVDTSTGLGTTTGGGKKIDAGTIINNTNANIEDGVVQLFANWFFLPLKPFVATASAGGNLLETGTVGGNWNVGTDPYTFDGKEYRLYWREGNANNTNPVAFNAIEPVAVWLEANSTATPFTANQIGTDALARFQWTLTGDALTYKGVYKTIRITYDLINFAGDMVMMVRSYNTGGGNSNIGPNGNNVTFKAGVDQTATFDCTRIGTDHTVINFIHNAADNYSLFRVTKIEFLP